MRHKKKKAGGNTYKNSYFRIKLPIICKIYVFKFIHEIISVFLLKEKSRKIATNNKNKNAKSR